MSPDVGRLGCNNSISTLSALCIMSNLVFALLIINLPLQFIISWIISLPIQQNQERVSVGYPIKVTIFSLLPASSPPFHRCMRQFLSQSYNIDSKICMTYWDVIQISWSRKGGRSPSDSRHHIQFTDHFPPMVNKGSETGHFQRTFVLHCSMFQQI